MLKPCIHCGKQLGISESEAADDLICTNCLYKAKWGIEDHIALFKESGLPALTASPSPLIIIRNERRLEKLGPISGLVSANTDLAR